IGGGAILLTLIALIVLAVRGRDKTDEIPRLAAASTISADSTQQTPEASASAREVKLEVDGADAAQWRGRMQSAADAEDWKSGAKAFLALAEMDPAELKSGTVREKALAVIGGIGVEQSALADEVFDLLTNRFGTDGLDMLFDVFRSRGGSKSAKRAEEI